MSSFSICVRMFRKEAAARVLVALLLPVKEPSVLRGGMINLVTGGDCALFSLVYSGGKDMSTYSMFHLRQARRASEMWTNAHTKGPNRSCPATPAGRKM